ncbi:MAG: hypothetical protein CMJ87_11195, partial [Planctomycetes bacterium]|nr:hypothetical protein [Planctomycetota bacterium]
MLCGAAHQQDPPLAVDLPLKLGREALAAGDLASARNHIREAIRRSPGDPELIALMLEACAGDGDALSSWGLDWMRAAADERGHGQPPPVLRA